MNDTLAPQKMKRNYFYIALASVAALMVAGVVASRSGLDKALLRQQLDAFAAALHSNGERQGRDVTLSYGEVDIQGSFSRKHGVIHDIKLIVKPLNKNGATISNEDSLVVSTPIAEIYPKSVDLQALQVQLPQPIAFTTESDPKKNLLTITAGTPLMLDIAQTQENNVGVLDLKHSVPSQIEFNYLRESQAEGEEDATPTIVPVYRKLLMTLAEGGSIQSKFTVDGKGVGAGSIDLHAIQIQPELVPNGAVKISEIVGRWSNAMDTNDRRSASLNLHVGDITASSDILPYAPISLVVDGTFDAANSASPKDVASITAPQSVIKLTQFLLSTNNAKLMAQADFTNNSGDILPEGKASVTLTNVPFVLKELRDNEIINAQNESIVTSTLELMTGQKLADVTDAVIDINRVRGGAFVIGKTTFEELFATFIKAALNRSQQPDVGLQQKPSDSKKPLEGSAPKPLKGTMIEDGSARA